MSQQTAPRMPRPFQTGTLLPYLAPVYVGGFLQYLRASFFTKQRFKYTCIDVTIRDHYEGFQLSGPRRENSGCWLSIHHFI